MEKYQLRRHILAAIAVLSGGYWLWIGRGFLNIEPMEGNFLPWFAAVMFYITSYLAVFAIAGLVVIFSGIELIRKPSPSAVKRITVVILIFAGLIIHAALLKWVDVFNDALGSVEGIWFCAVLILGVIAYPKTARLMMCSLGIEPSEKTMPRIGRGGLIILAWALCFLLWDLATMVLPPRNIAAFIALFGPPIISYGLYRFAAIKLGLPRPRKHLYAFEREGVEPKYPQVAKPD